MSNGNHPKNPPPPPPASPGVPPGGPGKARPDGVGDEPPQN
jgi:hypothetical protein